MTIQRMALRDVAACVAGADIPYLMNSLYGRILTAEERRQLHPDAVRHLTSEPHQWLQQVQTNGLTPDSEELRTWVRQQSTRHNYILEVRVIESPSPRTPAAPSGITMHHTAVRPYAS